MWQLALERISPTSSHRGECETMSDPSTLAADNGSRSWWINRPVPIKVWLSCTRQNVELGACAGTEVFPCV